MSDLNGKIAVVTGGNSGIGYSAAEDMKANGATVIITGRNAEKVNTAADTLGVTGMVADVSDLKAIDNLVDAVKRDFGNIDVLFINAGVFGPSPLGQTTEEMYDYQFDINVKGAYFTMDKFLSIMNEGGSIINLSSINAYAGMATTAVYSATKAALNSITRTAAVELAPRKIRVNSVNPGPVETPIFGKAGIPEDQIHGLAESITRGVPMSRFGQPSEIAKLVTFLASDNASYITGGEYNVDGGANINTIAV